MKTQVAVLAVLLAALPGCRQPDDQRAGDIDHETIRQAREALDPVVLAQIDSGNAAYREQRYEAALGFYREAARRDPNAAAAWFGVYMGELSLGNAAAADDALRRARDAAPRTSLVVEPAPADTAVRP